MCIYETRVRSRGDIGRVAASVWSMAVLMYICIHMYIYVRIRLYVGGSGDCTCIRLDHEVEGISVV